MPTATDSFVTSVDDVEVIVHAGDELPDDDPVVKANPELFGAAAPKKPTTAKRTTKKS
ncbi:MAG: hypothetical protein WB297_01835 [Actinomycetota bacterium]